ncbi:N utilization substance protein B [Elusimicrobium posterum]|uniref:transcription antitermination factor NusB n=1 Tax=Elusimicrobium posterum TaxID=3116653 RepID=UPI003C730C46
MGKRRLAREHALQTLYFADNSNVTQADIAEYKEDFKDKLDAENYEFCCKLIDGTLANKEVLDEKISSYAKNWTVSRMSVVDRSILRMAGFEIIFCDEKTPIPAIIDEAIELAKRFSTENSSRFINGLLDKMKDERKED